MPKRDAAAIKYVASGDILPKGVDEIEDAGDKELQQISQEAAPGDQDAPTDGNTYAGVVQTGKKPFPYCLYVQKGTERREPISLAHFKAFEKALSKIRFKMSPEENQSIVIEWSCYQNGRGIVAAADANSAKWVKTFAAEFPFGRKTTSAWS